MKTPYNYNKINNDDQWLVCEPIAEYSRISAKRYKQLNQE